MSIDVLVETVMRINYIYLFALSHFYFYCSNGSGWYDTFTLFFLLKKTLTGKIQIGVGS